MSFLKQCGITPGSAVLRERKVVKLRFPTDASLQQLVRKEGAVWSRSLNAWYIESNKSLLIRFVKKVAAERGVSVERPEITALRRQIRLKGYSPNTEQAYAQLLEQFLDHFYPLQPEALSKSEIENYLLLLQQRGLGESSIHTTINAIKFYLEQVAGASYSYYNLPRPKKPLKVVAIFSPEEIKAILKAVENPKHKAMLVLGYSSGLRISEIIALTINDVDSYRMVLTLRGAKGKKDRVVPLSQTGLRILREYFLAYKPKGPFLFEGQDGKSAYSSRSLQNVLAAAKGRAGIKKEGSLHALRHSYATHLLDKGTDIVYIQKILGHNDLKTTLRYLHVTTRDLHKIVSPIEDLGIYPPLYKTEFMAHISP